MIVGERLVNRIGLLRNDALGDTILTLAVASATKQLDRSVEVELVCDGAYMQLLAAHPDLDAVVADPGGPAADLARLLASRNYDALLVLRPTPRNAWAAFRARIPLRVGTAFRAYGLLFNVRWYGHRKTNERHEVEYNLELLKQLTGMAAPGSPQNYVPPPPEDEAPARALLEEMGILSDRPLVAIHPGSGRRADGRHSSLAWPVHHFVTLAEMFVGADLQVIVTGMAVEAGLTSQVANIEGVADLTGHTTLSQLAWVFKQCDTVIVNSTGTLHLAAAVGTKVVGIYPPTGANSPVRWGPHGPGHKVFTGPIEECRRRECTWEECPAYNCLEKVRPEEVFEVAMGIIAQSPLRSRWEASTSSPKPES